MVQCSESRRPSSVQASGEIGTRDGVRGDERRCGDRHAEEHLQASRSSGAETMKRYAIVVEAAAANFSAYVPDLPGCVATGKSVAETERRLSEAIELHIQGLQEDGLPVPEPTSVVDYVEVGV